MEGELLKKVRADKFANFVGIKFVEVSEGYAVTELELHDNHLNGFDRPQGGVLFTLADVAFAAASNSGGISTLGININITYFKAATGKIIRATAQEISAQNRICGCNVKITDEDGSLLAIFNGVGYRKK
jgi:acyl-CoA thioesterase